LARPGGTSLSMDAKGVANARRVVRASTPITSMFWACHPPVALIATIASASQPKNGQRPAWHGHLAHASRDAKPVPRRATPARGISAARVFPTRHQPMRRVDVPRAVFSGNFRSPRATDIAGHVTVKDDLERFASAT